MTSGKTDGKTKKSVKVCRYFIVGVKPSYFLFQAVSHEASKAAARNKKMQLLKNQRDRDREQRKKGMPPRLVLILPFSRAASASSIKSALAGHCGITMDGLGPTTVTPPQMRHKQAFTLMALPLDNVFDVLEAALVADIIVPVVDCVEGVSEEALNIASVIKAQGMPAVLPVLSGVQNMVEKNRHAAKKGLLSDLQYLFPNVTRVLPADEGADDVQQIFRFLEQVKLQELHYPARRSFVVATSVTFDPISKNDAPKAQFLGNVDEEESMGILKVTGHVRGGNGMSADHIFHIAGIGDLHVESILDGNTGQVLHAATENRPSLQNESDPDPFAGGEQTWPTADDVKMAGMEDDDNDGSVEQQVQTQVRVKRRVPKGVSEYQAAWLIDSDDSEGGDEDGSDEGGEMEDDNSSVGGGGSQVEDDPEGAAGLDHMQDDEEVRSKRERRKEEQMFPDEVEVPADEPARERFQKYRGLDSFRSSVWDSKENLPVDYSRIFQIENYAHFVRKNSKADVDTVLPGQFVTLVIKFPVKFFSSLHPSRPLVVGTLLKHEHKISVLHFDIMQSKTYAEPIASKEELIVTFGLHRIRVNPLFSQHVPGCDKCKYERFLPADASSMATFYGPITYSPCTVSMFKMINGKPVLVASGSLRTVNADLLIIKKIILTANPARIHKRTALCRGMFHNPEDVKWFKPVSLWTKQGRVGHVRESNGTKGDFKGVFDGRLNSSDTVCMSLYRRVFPNWDFENFKL